MCCYGAMVLSCLQQLILLEWWQPENKNKGNNQFRLNLAWDISLWNNFLPILKYGYIKTLSMTSVFIALPKRRSYSITIIIIATIKPEITGHNSLWEHVDRILNILFRCTVFFCCISFLFLVCSGSFVMLEGVLW